MKNVYLDNSATTRMDSSVLEEMIPFLSDNYGNASSVYSIGRLSKKAIEDSREKVANILNCRPDEIYFTSGGSESDNTAIKGIARANKEKGKHIITSKIEHLAVLDTCKKLEEDGFEVTYLDVDKYGRINLDELKSSIRKDTILISIMYANNEVGTIQQISQIGKIAKENNIYFHTDAVQAIGSVKIDVQAQNIDSLSLSAHKFYGPKGIGVLYVKKDIKFEKFIDGGHQERNQRAGTENVAGIVGLGKACEIANKNMTTHIRYLSKLRAYYLMKLQKEIPGKFRINGGMENRLPGNANISFKGIDSSELIFKLDERGICVSSGSACSSGNIEPSHVLTAINVPAEYLNSAIRTTFGDSNTFEQVDYLIKCLKGLIK